MWWIAINVNLFMNLVIILVSNPNRMMLNPNVMSLLQVINFIVILLVFFGIYWGFLNKFLFFLLLQLSKIESGCLLNQFLMWFKDYEKLQHLLLSTQTLNRKSACFFCLFFRNALLLFINEKFWYYIYIYFLYLGLLQLYNLLQCWNFPQQIQTMIHQVNQLLSTTLTLMAEKVKNVI